MIDNREPPESGLKEWKFVVDISGKIRGTVMAESRERARELLENNQFDEEFTVREIQVENVSEIKEI